MGRRMTPPMGMSPPIFSAIWTICYHCNMLLLQIPLLNWIIEQPLFLWRSLDLSMHQTCAIPYIMKQKIWTKYQPSTSCTKMCPPFTTPMYINIIQCAKRYHPWNVSTICLYQHVNMCIYQYANHVHPPICQLCASTNMKKKFHITHDMSLPWTKCLDHQMPHVPKYMLIN